MSCPLFSVTISAQSMVVPSEPTPSHTLPLTCIDLMSMRGELVELFMVYQHGVEPATVIREALGKALVPYYPFAGRLVQSEVACTGEGAWFVEARAGCTLADVGGVEQAPLLAVPKEQLLPFAPPHPDPLTLFLMLQVTQFRCGGFVLGIRYNHIIADGVGIFQFLKAVADLARGLERPRVEPVWSRESIPGQTVLSPPSSAGPGVRLETLTTDLSQSHIDRMIREYKEQTGIRCSTLDVVIAQIWRCRTRAIGLDPAAFTNFMIPADGRPQLSHLLPHGGRGYYGNCVYGVVVTARAGEIADASVADIVALLGNAKKRAKASLSSLASGGGGVGDVGDVKQVVTIGYESMGMTDMSNLGANEVDFGWGEPGYITIAPLLPDSIHPPLCFVTRRPAPLQTLGRRVVTIFLKEEHVKAFKDEMDASSGENNRSAGNSVAKSKL